MIKYGNTLETAIALYDLAGTLTYVHNKQQIVRHYPGTDKTQYVALGKSSTSIKCILKCSTEADALLIEQLLHDDDSKNLYIERHDRFYKEVVTGSDFQMLEKKPNQKLWLFSAEFIALDPIPYDIDTGGALY